MRKEDVRVKSSGHGKWGRKGAGKLVSLMFVHRVEIIQIHTPHPHTYAHMHVLYARVVSLIQELRQSTTARVGGVGGWMCVYTLPDTHRRRH
jgi:hypothetical protein